MEQLWIALTKAVEGTSFIALCASFAWGICSVVLSPCHLSSIPLIVGFISEQGKVTKRRAFGISFLFGLGILLSIALLGVVTASMGRLMGDVGRYGNYVVSAVFFLVGLHLADVITIPIPGIRGVGMKRRGLLASFILGLVFGIALGPCTFAYMAPILAVSFKAAATNLIYGTTLLAVYGIGHCSVVVAAGASTESVQRYLNWNEKSHGALIVKRICGVLVLAGGVYLIYVAG